ncbi:MAG: hypothetical protein NZL85_03130 [Fimbriimonadales bacterium]|nr:hypothetical protein [Fimbriimonadales bacterium]
MVIHHCLRGWLKRYGEPFVIRSQLKRGLFVQPPGGLLRWLYSSTELELLPRPLWLVLFLPDIYPLPDETLEWRGTTYRVLRMVEFRHPPPDPLYRLMLIAPV